MKHLPAAMPQVLWLVLTLALVIVSPLAPPPMAAAAGSPIVSSPAPRAQWSLPGCPDMCGNVRIPYPFGIGAECAWPRFRSFTVACNHNFNPPRPYVRKIEIKSISVETGEMHVFTPVAYRCYNSSKTVESRGTIGWELHGPFLISQKNVLTAIGCDTQAFLEGTRAASNYLTGCISYCERLDDAADDQQCAGIGCCQTSIPTNLTELHVAWGKNRSNPAWEYSPCSYGFVATKDWYNFSVLDLSGRGNESFISRVGKSTVPLALDWAIMKNGSCQVGPEASGASGKPKAPACVSDNSECVVSVAQRHGYLCNCSQGYQGNPYIPKGCQDIDECDLRKQNPMVYKQLYPCGSGSKCKNTQGDYKCKCKFGHKGDGRNGKGCQPILPAPAVAAAATFVAVVLACFVIALLQKRERGKRFTENGGEILKVMGIKIFTEGELKKVTNGYKKVIGEGAFGKVYMGRTINGGEQVAVKCSFTRSKAPHDEFRNEITFQFRINHPNVVRLTGCCLETDVPKLVFELVPNGSLQDLLHVRRDQRLSLPTRLHIAIGSAEALSYMHSQGGRNNHVHGDFKSGNILLDNDLTPKVSDFGSAKLVSILSGYEKWCVSGDMNYIDPTYIKTGCFTEKSDVYSFGVVLLELITRKKAMYDGRNSLPINFVKSCKEEGNGRAMYDPEIRMSDDAQAHHYMECMHRIGTLAVQCLKEDVDERPDMAQVLKQLKQVQEIARGG